jgi:hypothetical protein
MWTFERSTWAVAWSLTGQARVQPDETCTHIFWVRLICIHEILYIKATNLRLQRETLIFGVKTKVRFRSIQRARFYEKSRWNSLVWSIHRLTLKAKEVEGTSSIFCKFLIQNRVRRYTCTRTRTVHVRRFWHPRKYEGTFVLSYESTFVLPKVLRGYTCTRTRTFEGTALYTCVSSCVCSCVRVAIVHVFRAYVYSAQLYT